MCLCVCSFVHTLNGMQIVHIIFWSISGVTIQYNNMTKSTYNIRILWTLFVILCLIVFLLNFNVLPLFISNCYAMHYFNGLSRKSCTILDFWKMLYDDSVLIPNNQLFYFFNSHIQIEYSAVIANNIDRIHFEYNWKYFSKILAHMDDLYKINKQNIQLPNCHTAFDRTKIKKTTKQRWIKKLKKSAQENV